VDLLQECYSPSHVRVMVSSPREHYLLSARRGNTAATPRGVGSRRPFTIFFLDSDSQSKGAKPWQSTHT
jgi:hypothetical protein